MPKSIAAAALLILTGTAAQAHPAYGPRMTGYDAEPQDTAASPGPEYYHPLGMAGAPRYSRGPHYRMHAAYGPRVRWHAGYAAGYAGSTGYQPYPTPGYEQGGIPVVSDVAAAGVTTVAGIAGFGLGGFSNWGGGEGYTQTYVGHCGCRNGWNF